MMGLSYPANMFVALSSPPTKRAAWTAGSLYVLVTLFMLFGSPREFMLISPLVGVPGFLIAFWFWRREYRKAWIDHPAEYDGELENDDWKAGLIKFIGLFIAAIIATLVRRSLHH